MKKAAKRRQDQPVDDMRSEYDFTGGVRGKYAKAYAQGTNLVLLDADLAEAFPTSEAVNTALRALVPPLANNDYPPNG
jgi:hypothetical protein